MKLAATKLRRANVRLTRPYAIAGGAWDTAELVFVTLETDAALQGHGLAAPAFEVTGESAQDSARALAPPSLAWLVGRTVPSPESFADELSARVQGPAARAALDMALHDLAAKRAGLPLVAHLGRRIAGALPTSVTIGVKSLAATLAEADEYVGRGFRCLKVKGGVDVTQDLERLARLRERFGARVELRFDANMGYDTAALARLVARMDALDLELIEQPLPTTLDEALLDYPTAVRARFAADESVQDIDDLARLAALGAPFGAVNVKLMKCGGVTRALALAAAAGRAGLGVMWGCMDESALGIAAALHAAYACGATRWLDLDGSLDLACEPFPGGFALGPPEDGGARRDHLFTLDAPGLGAEPA